MTDPSPLDDIEFLARSPHRVEVLRRLTEGAYTRPDLHDQTGISQPTLGRVLTSLEERHWVERYGREYGLTALGQLVAEAFTDLLDTFETVHGLEDVIPLLPINEIGLDVQHFTSASVTAPGPGDVLAHIRRVEELVYGATDLRLVADTVAPGTAEDARHRMANFQESDQRVESIVTNDSIGPVLDDPTIREGFRAVLDSGRVSIYRYDGPVPLMLAVSDGIGVLVPKDDHGVPAAVIETEDEAVLRWINAEIDHYREQSIQLTGEELAPHES